MNKKTFQCPEVRIISMTTESIIAASAAMYNEHAEIGGGPSAVAAVSGRQW